MVTAIVTEKPSVARDIAACVGARQRREGYLEGEGFIVTWALGHLVGLAQPHEIDPRWKAWRRALLPMLPAEWPLSVLPDGAAQFAVIRRILRDRAVRRVISATDAGREGELIFRFIYEAAECQKPVERLWISSLTSEAIRAGLARLRPARDLDGLAQAARGRAQADWLVGMNLSRVYTLGHGDLLSVGRVQTPTLALLVAREREIQAFVPEAYQEVVATFLAEGQPYQGTWFRAEAGTLREAAEPLRRRLPPDGVEAAAIVARVQAAGRGQVVHAEEAEKRLPPPLLYDLSELQRHANRLYGMSAQRTLDTAQRLYEQRKLLTYPRTDSRHLSADVARTLPAVVAAVAPRYPGLVAPQTHQRPLGRRYVDDAKVSDHHAIIPTPTSAEGVQLTPDEARIYDLVCRRLLSAWHADHTYAVTQVLTRTGPDDLFHTRGSRVLVPGWKVLDVAPRGRGGAGAAKPPRAAVSRHAGDAGPDDDDTPDQALPTALRSGLGVPVREVEAKAKETKPPKRLTEANLLTAMETAGATLDDKALSQAMRERGLGTPATRAATIETLLARGYVERDGKVLRPTEKGLLLVDRVHPHVKSPAMTGEWEARLRQIERGERELAPFMRDIEAFVTEVVGGAPSGPGDAQGGPSGAPCGVDAGHEAPRPRTRVERAAEPTGARAAEAITGARAAKPTSPRAAEPTRAQAAEATTGARAEKPTSPPAAETSGARAVEPSDPRAAKPTRARAAKPTDPRTESPAPGPSPQAAPPPPAPEPTPAATRARLRACLAERFGHDGYRAHQEAVCLAAAEGHDVLVVMPTGAGKSLCYQLPGLVRGGTTVVISPLIALIEDQVAKLEARGLRAARIHSGRGRAESRATCVDYVEGRLDYLFVAPERLGVPGFLELLARRPPTLVAVDEAHCISQWGHDFRPDYRMLGPRLARLRPAPIIALTATATRVVQDDIAAQLGLARGRRFIHGFRRDNIAIEVVEAPRPERPGVVAALLRAPEHRPAIVYTTSRKEAEGLASALGRWMSIAPYHAGMSAAARDDVQRGFLEGRVDVVAATIAFGMGVDKPDVRTVVHTALPQTVEGYYQEIGRAGRDGRPSRAVLLHGFADQRMHTFFLERSYPDVALLERLRAKVPPGGVAREALVDSVRGKRALVDEALAKLWIHGGVQLDADDHVTRGHDDWRARYGAQRAHREAQSAEMVALAADHGCRMLRLVRHFGDETDGGRPCGLCDVCAPEACQVRAFRAPTPGERATLGALLASITRAPGRALGTLQREVEASGRAPGLDRDALAVLVGGLARAGLVTLSDDHFEKDGETINFQRVAPTPAARGADEATLARVRLASTVTTAEPLSLPGKRRGQRRGADGRAARGRTSPRTREATPRAAKTARTPRPRAATAERATARSTERSSTRARARSAEPAPLDPRTAALADALRAWRLAEAKKRRAPAFRVLTDKTLLGIAAERPRSADALRAIPGFGPKLAATYTTAILSLVERATER